jgi:hypothetical protein
MPSSPNPSSSRRRTRTPFAPPSPRQRRCWGIESRILPDAVAAATAADPLGRYAQDFSTLAATPQLDLMHRYETTRRAFT